VSFRRYAGPGPASGQISISMLEAPSELPLRELAVGLALLLAAVGVWAAMRGQGPPVPAGGAPGPTAPGAPRGGAGTAPPATPDPIFVDERRKLLIEVAAIDEALESGEATGREAERLRRRRATLITRIRNLG
jgi:hypothetical protein